MEQLSADTSSLLITPSSSITVLPDPPKFTIVSVTDSYLLNTAQSRDALLGKGLFETPCSNPDDPHQTSTKTVLASLEYALAHKEPHYLPVLRYGVPKSEGGFEQRWWSVCNKPVLDENGTVSHLVLSIEDATQKINAEQKAANRRHVEKAYEFFMQAPVIIGVVRGDDYVIELANEGLLDVWGRTADVIGKPLLEAIPELKGQGFIELLDNVRSTGESYQANEAPTRLRRRGKEEVLYIDFVYKPYHDNTGETKAGAVMAVGHDVTERVLARKKAAENEEKYRSLFHSMKQGFYVVEVIFNEDSQPTDYRFLETNPVFETQTGLINAVGKTVRQLIPQIERHWIETYGEVALTGEPVHVVEKSNRLDRWFDLNAFRLGGAESRKVGVFFTDVTDQKKAEQARRKAEALQAFLLKLSDALRPIQDPLEIQYQAACTLGQHVKANRVGYAEDSGDGMTIVVTRNYTDGVEGIEGRYRYEDYGADLLATLRAGNTVTWQDVKNEPALNETEKQAHANLQVNAVGNIPLVKNGQLLGLLFIHWREAHKWTEEELALLKETAERTWSAVERAKAEKELRRSEERFRAMVSQAAVGIAQTADGNFTYVNDRFCEMTGRNRERLIGLPLTSITHPGDAERDTRLLKRMYATGESFVVDQRYVRPDGSLAWVLNSVTPLRDEDGIIYGGFAASVDVTDRKRAEDELLKAHQRIANILESTSDNFFALDKEGRFTYINPRAEAHFNLRCQDVLGKTFTDVLPKLRGHEVLRRYQKALETGQPDHFQFSSPISGRWIDLYLFPADWGLSAYFRDITEKRTAEEALRRSEERLQKVLSIETVGVIYFDLDGGIHAANPAFERMSGYSQQAIASGVVRWEQLTPPEFRDATLRSKQEFLTQGQNTPYKKQYIRPDGSRWWGLFAGKRLSETECVEFVVDITKTKQIEEGLEGKVQERTAELEAQKSLLDNILTNSSNGISVTEMIRDKNGEVADALTILANEAAVKFTGLPRDIYLTKTATEIDPGILRSPYGQMCLHTLKTGEPSFTQYHLELTNRWLELTLSRMDENHLIHIFTDVTPIKEAQLQLERSVEDLKRTNQNLEEFAYAASHDMKEPIRKIQLFADRLKIELQDRLSENQVRLFARMERAAQRMGALIDDLLTYSHVSRGTQHVEAIDLNQKLSAVLEDLEVAIEEKQAEVSVEHLPTIKGHRRQLAQLFQNLVGNALKYSKAGEVPRIRISAKEVHGREIPLPLPPDEAAKAFHLIEVSDNGIGFAQDDAERIFNVFTRLHGNTEYRGTGVGLSIVRKVAENHGGYIWAESEEGKGATFRLLLPK